MTLILNIAGQLDCFFERELGVLQQEVRYNLLKHLEVFGVLPHLPGSLARNGLHFDMQRIH